MAEDWKTSMHSWLRSHHGVVPVSQLRSWGCSRRDAYRLAEGDSFELVMPGILRSTHHATTPTQLMIAACLRCPHAVVGRLSAAREWSFRSVAEPDHVLILLPHGKSATLPGVTVERSTRLTKADIVRRDDGVRLTSPPRTLFDCASVLGVKRTTSILEQLINDGHGSLPTHLSTFARLASPRRAGTREMREVLDSRPPLRAAMQSQLEVTVLDAIERAGIARPEVQHWVTLPLGDRVRLDFAWPALRVALEVDHPFWHAGAAESQRDKRRDRALATLGWITIRITDVDVHQNLAAAIAELATVLARR